MPSRRTREANRGQKRRNYARQKKTVLARNKRWRDRHPEIKAKSTRKSWLRRYGLTPETFEAKLLSQDTKCANEGCRAAKPGGSSNQWHIDHDHICCGECRGCVKCIRGLLCNRCNRALGIVGEDLERFMGLLEYILRYNPRMRRQQDELTWESTGRL